MVARRTGTVKEIFLFIRETRAWWIAPIVIVLLFVLFLVVLGSTSLAPFIYTVF